MTKLLIKVLGAEKGPYLGDEYIKEIVNEMNELDLKEKRSLQEVLLKRNIITKLI